MKFKNNDFLKIYLLELQLHDFVIVLHISSYSNPKLCKFDPIKIIIIIKMLNRYKRIILYTKTTYI